MGYALNVGISIPTSIIIYMLTNKILSLMTEENNIQTKSIITFIISICFIVLGMSIFASNSNIGNQVIQYGLYISGGYMILQTLIFNWDHLDEYTKIIILGIILCGFIYYSYIFL